MAQNKDRFNLARFISAQEKVYPAALNEIRQGQKQSHWMWFVFPQIAGLGHSQAAIFYSVKSQAEAAAYLQHPLLGARLIQCCEALLQLEGKSAHFIFGFPDERKLQSCMTLFSTTGDAPDVFLKVLKKYFSSEKDAATLDILKQQQV